MQRVVEELRSLAHVGDKTIQKLIDAGVGGLAHLLEMTEDEICQIEGIGPKTAEKIRHAAAEAKVIWDKRDAEEAARFEAERLAAEQAAAEEEARRLAEEQAAAEEAAAEEAAGTEAVASEGEEPPAAEDPGEGEAEVAPVAAGEGSSEGGKPDAER